MFNKCINNYTGFEHSRILKVDHGNIVYIIVDCFMKILQSILKLFQENHFLNKASIKTFTVFVCRLCSP